MDFWHKFLEKKTKVKMPWKRRMIFWKDNSKLLPKIFEEKKYRCIKKFDPSNYRT
jgi:hypothetical protein